MPIPTSVPTGETPVTSTNSSAHDVDLHTTVARCVAWLNRHNGTGDQERTLRILKVTEEAGEVAAAWIGVMGQNPRKGVTHIVSEVADELADVVGTALIAMASLGQSPEAVMARWCAKANQRLDLCGEPAMPDAVAEVAA
jgi:NTP pyrophosphatase (non-canonical NTP hydrolase)